MGLLRKIDTFLIILVPIVSWIIMCNLRSASSTLPELDDIIFGNLLPSDDPDAIHEVAPGESDEGLLEDSSHNFPDKFGLGESKKKKLRDINLGYPNRGLEEENLGFIDEPAKDYYYGGYGQKPEYQYKGQQSADPGAYGTNPGYGPGSNYGYKRRYEPIRSTYSFKSGYKPGYKSEYGPGYNSGPKSGYSSGYKPGYRSDSRPAFKADSAPGYRSYSTPAYKSDSRGGYASDAHTQYKSHLEPASRSDYKPVHKSDVEQGYKASYKRSYGSVNARPSYNTNSGRKTTFDVGPKAGYGSVNTKPRYHKKSGYYHGSNSAYGPTNNRYETESYHGQQSRPSYGNYRRAVSEEEEVEDLDKAEEIQLEERDLSEMSPEHVLMDKPEEEEKSEVVHPEESDVDGRSIGDRLTEEEPDLESIANSSEEDISQHFETNDRKVSPKFNHKMDA